MKILAFDTSTKYLSIALVEDGRVAARFHEDMGIRHSEVLAPKIGELAGEAGWKIGDIGLISAGIGPGSFTGLRIGVATAKGIAAVTGCRVIGIPSMDAMLSEVPESVRSFAPLLDARKEKVYSSIYETSEGRRKKIRGPELVTIDRLLSELGEKVVFFGDGIDRYRETIEKCPFAEINDDIDWYPRAEEIARLGVERSKGETVDPADLEPLYLYSRECSITNE